MCYDNQDEYKDFCNALSRIIQNSHSDQDLIELIKFQNVEDQHMDEINSVVNLEQVLF